MLRAHSRHPVSLLKEGEAMSVAKVSEISSSSPTSFEDAIQGGIARATKTLKNVKGAWVNEQSLVIENDKIVEYRVNMKITFILQ